MMYAQAMFAALLLAMVVAPLRAAETVVPAAWLARWNNPPLEDRPLQIVHGLQPLHASGEALRDLADRGLGGLVTNVPFDKYLESEEHWQTFAGTIEACKQQGLSVWIYDEKGYPSGSAGGLVLRKNPAHEALELAFDPSRPDPFVVRPAFEHTHASNNYHAARRYINLIDAEAVQSFLTVTHEQYAARVGADFGRSIRATFTDEPSLMPVNLGAIPEPARSRVPVDDPVDPGVKALPAVPWSRDLAQQYQLRYGEDLLPGRRSLFEGDSAEDWRIRRQFWALIADLVADRYFGAIQKWCHAHGIASSGHCLWEEGLIHHPALVGNCLQALRRMDIPGLDMLSSDPETVIHSGWLTAALPASAATLNGTRKVMTEVSDFSQKMGGAGPVDLDRMRATAAWQAVWGVTEFTLYYGLGDRPAETQRAYGDFVGRLNAVLKPARRESRVLLYYPVHDLWAEYRPVAEPLRLASQSERAQRIVNSFMRCGQMLQRCQRPFTLVDHGALAQMTVANGALSMDEHGFTALVLPEDVELPEAAAAVVGQFRQQGGHVLDSEALLQTPAKLGEMLPADFRLEPPSDRVALGHFSREGKTVLVVVNVGQEPFAGKLVGDTAGEWSILDPARGALRRGEPTGETIRLDLEGHQTLLFVR